MWSSLMENGGSGGWGGGGVVIQGVNRVVVIDAHMLLVARVYRGSSDNAVGR